MYLDNELISIIQKIEAYNPENDFIKIFSTGVTIWDRLNSIKAFYKKNEDYIISFNKRYPRKFYDIFSFDFDYIFSPIEKIAWHYIRLQRMVLYPQYPILNYILDFGNPYLKIGLELDGKEFHDKEKDRFRDQKIFDKEGWMIFRITGSEANRVISKPKQNSVEQSYDEYFFNSIEGIIESINQVFFYSELLKEDEWIYNKCISSLYAHKLADFKIIL